MTVGHGDDLPRAVGGHAVGGPVRHIPVLLGEVLEALAPEEGDIIIDGTFGAGGYTRAILATGASVVAIASGSRPGATSRRTRGLARGATR